MMLDIVRAMAGQTEDWPKLTCVRYHRMVRGLHRGSATLYRAALWEDCSLLFRGRQAYLGQPVLIVMFQFHCVPAQPLAELRAFLARDHLAWEGMFETCIGLGVRCCASGRGELRIDRGLGCLRGILMICMPSYSGSSRVYHDGDQIIVPPNMSVEAQFVSDRLALGATWSLPWGRS